VKTRIVAAMGRRFGQARRGRPGLTLIEVLATVFVLGMGLIMVAAAFPVGIDQMRRTKDDTQAAELARTAMNMVRAGNFAQSATSAVATVNGWAVLGFGSVWPYGFSTLKPLADMSLAAGTGAAGTYTGMVTCDPSASTSAFWAPDLFSNPNALAYGSSGPYQTSNIIISTSIANNTLACIPVLTRMASPLGSGRVEGAGAPLYRVTLVVVKYTGQPSTTGRLMPLVARANATGTGNNITITGNMPGGVGGTVSENIGVDDGVLILYGAPTASDLRTGYVYRVVENQYSPSTSTGTQFLDDNPGISGSGDCLVFFNFVAAYYAYIGG